MQLQGEVRKQYVYERDPWATDVAMACFVSGSARARCSRWDTEMVRLARMYMCQHIRRTHTIRCTQPRCSFALQSPPGSGARFISQSRDRAPCPFLGPWLRHLTKSASHLLFQRFSKVDERVSVVRLRQYCKV